MGFKLLCCHRACNIEQIEMIEENYRQVYYRRIKDQIRALNGLQETQIISKTGGILRQIKLIDLEFMRQCGVECVGQILFTRHGKCHIWSQKRFGLNPNSALSEEAIQAMSITKKITKELQVFPQKPMDVWVSPMVRAKQTAMLIIPETSKVNIEYDISLSENSQKPSSSFITSTQQLKREYELASIFDSFKKAVTYTLSNAFYGNQQTFTKIQRLSEQADAYLQARSSQPITFLDRNPQAERQKQLTEYTSEVKLQKLEQIVTKYSLSEEMRDVWFVGHSKNLKKFFKVVLDNKNSFGFGQTRRLYQVKSKAEKRKYYFNPPYSLLVNQQTGGIGASFVENSMRLQQMIQKNLEVKIKQ